MQLLFRLLIALPIVALLANCETTKKDEADTGSILREPDTGGETHGEVGAMYGASAGH